MHRVTVAGPCSCLAMQGVPPICLPGEKERTLAGQRRTRARTEELAPWKPGTIKRALPYGAPSTGAAVVDLVGLARTSFPWVALGASQPSSHPGIHPKKLIPELRLGFLS